MIIAIDGPAAAGKGTLARMLAENLGYAYLDSGALYRATALSVYESGGDADSDSDAVRAAEKIDPERLSDPALRQELIGQIASKVAAYPGVRDALLQFQRDFAHSPPNGAAGAIIDGRDIGTVVCPDAEIKLFVTASAEARARRRTLELEEKGETADYESVLEAVRARDQMDQTRATSPLVPADDALILDTTELDIENAFKAALALIRDRISV